MHSCWLSWLKQTYFCVATCTLGLPFVLLFRVAICWQINFEHLKEIFTRMKYPLLLWLGTFCLQSMSDSLKKKPQPPRRGGPGCKAPHSHHEAVTRARRCTRRVAHSRSPRVQPGCCVNGHQAAFNTAWVAGMSYHQSGLSSAGARPHSVVGTLAAAIAHGCRHA